MRRTRRSRMPATAIAAFDLTTRIEAKRLVDKIAACRAGIAPDDVE